MSYFRHGSFSQHLISRYFLLHAAITICLIVWLFILYF